MLLSSPHGTPLTNQQHGDMLARRLRHVNVDLDCIMLSREVFTVAAELKLHAERYEHAERVGLPFALTCTG